MPLHITIFNQTHFVYILTTCRRRRLLFVRIILVEITELPEKKCINLKHKCKQQQQQPEKKTLLCRNAVGVFFSLCDVIVGITVVIRLSSLYQNESF